MSIIHRKLLLLIGETFYTSFLSLQESSGGVRDDTNELNMANMAEL
jgi:hypothetical protein